MRLRPSSYIYTLPARFQSWPSAAGELISSSRLLPWEAFLATKGIREAGACADAVADGGGVSWQVRMLTYADVC